MSLHRDGESWYIQSECFDYYSAGGDTPDDAIEWFWGAYKLKEQEDHVLVYPKTMVADGVKDEAYRRYVDSWESNEWFLAA